MGNPEAGGGDPVHVVEKVALGLIKDVQRNCYVANWDRFFLC
jgi:hypothetical protein